MPEIEDILSGQEITTEAPPEIEPAQPEVTPDTPTTPETGDQQTAPPAPGDELEELRRQVHAFKRAAIDERHKRQEYETALKQKEQPKTDFWENPEEAINSAVGSVRQELEADFTRRLLNMSEASAELRHQDYTARRDEFMQLAQGNPTLFHQMMQAPDPAEFAYQTAARIKAMREMGDPATYRQKIEAELRAKLEAEYAAKYRTPAQAALDQRLPPGFSETRGQAPTVREDTGPAPLSDILK